VEQRELAHADGRPLDAEAMLLLPGGGLVVADEGCGCLVSFAAGAARPTGPSRPVPGLGGGELNQGVEALAGLPDGALLAIGEAEDGGADRHRAVRMGGGRDARTRYYRSAPGFRPTDAAASGPYLFVLERSVSILGGWRSRLVALARDRLDDAEATLAERELAVLSGPRIGENHEALAVVRDGAGYRILLIADDNFSPLQRTLLVALEWLPG